MTQGEPHGTRQVIAQFRKMTSPTPDSLQGSSVYTLSRDNINGVREMGATSTSTSDYTGSMKILRSKDFTASRAWGALDIANMNGITTRLHWTDQPYKWHINEGEEVFAVLDGRVEMRYKDNGQELSTVLQAGDIFHASVGTEHVAHPIGEARILVVEREGSV